MLQGLNFKQRLLLLTTKIIIQSIAHLPLRVCHVLGHGLGLILFYLPNRHVNISKTNIRLCFPHYSSLQQRNLVKHSMLELGKTVMEMPVIFHAPRERIQSYVKQVSGEHYAEQALIAGKGFILAAPHLGCWEISGLYCSIRFGITSLYRPPRMAYVEQLLLQARQRFGAKLVPTDTHGIKQLYTALQNNGVVGILPDQDPGQSTGEFVPFFGIPAKTMVLLPRLARKTKAPVFFVYSERLPKGQGFHLHFIPCHCDVYSGELSRAVQCSNVMVELCVTRIPAQYQWSYKRFRTRPTGWPELYHNQVKR